VIAQHDALSWLLRADLAAVEIEGSRVGCKSCRARPNQRVHRDAIVAADLSGMHSSMHDPSHGGAEALRQSKRTIKSSTSVTRGRAARDVRADGQGSPGSAIALFSWNQAFLRGCPGDLGHGESSLVPFFLSGVGLDEMINRRPVRSA